MHELEPQEPAKPKLQLEYSGDGPGQKSKTAVATDGGGPELDRSTLPDAPWWFGFVEVLLKRKYQKHFQKLSLTKAMPILKYAGVPPIYRIGLGLRWGFIIPDRDDFTVEDFGLIMPSSQAPAQELNSIESRSTYQIWKKVGSRLSTLEQFVQVMED